MPRGSLETIAADADFPALRYAVDHEYILWRVGGATGAKGVVREIDVLDHKPGRRCTVRYAIELGGEDFSVVGKWYRAPGQASAMHGLIASLLATELSLPSLVHGSEHVVMQHFVPGQELRFLVDAYDTRPFAEAGRWLARLHAIDNAPGLKHKSTAHELSKVNAWCRDLSAALPEHAELLNEISSSLLLAADHLRQVSPSVIHRDYYPGNLLWDGGTLWAIDFDQMALGDPAMDAGTFLAQLEKIVIRDQLSPEHLDAKSRAFEDAYRDARDEDFVGRVPFFKSYTFLKLAAAEAQRRRERWQELTSAFLSRAAEEALAAR